MMLINFFSKVSDIIYFMKTLIMSALQSDPVFFILVVAFIGIVLYIVNEAIVPTVERIKERKFFRMISDIANAAQDICLNLGEIMDKDSSEEHFLYEGNNNLTIAVYEGEEVAIYDGENLVFLVSGNQLDSFRPGIWSRRIIWQELMELADKIGDKRYEKEVLNTASRYYK